jgi:excisionase family DNA binding protein
MISAKEASALLGVAPRTMYSLAAPAGPLPCYRVGRAVRFEEADVMQYKAKCLCAPAPRTSALPLRSVAISKAVGSDLRRSFLALGIKPRLDWPK